MNENRPLLDRRRFLQAAGVLAGTAALEPLIASCQNAKANAKGGPGSFPSHPRYKFTFIGPQITNPFFTPVNYGYADACSLLGCDYQSIGSKTADVAEMVDQFNAAISAKADGIGIAIVDPTAFNAPIEKAYAAGIPVTSFNADGGTKAAKKRLAYYGQDLYLAGYQMGQRIAQLVPGGDVVLFISVPGQLNTQPRVDGAKQAIKDSGKSINVSVVGTGVNLDERYSNIDAYYLGHKSLKGMFAVDSGSTNGIGMAIQKHGLAGKVVGGGFDLVPGTLTAIKAGNLAFTIDQAPYLQGFLQVIGLFLFNISGGLVAPANTNTGLKFVTKENVDPYISNQTRFEGNSAAEKTLPRSGAIAMS